MAGYRVWLQCSLSIVLALTSARIAWSQTVDSGELVEKKTVTCKVYSLAELGDDPKLCKWVAETIPEMIQPASWKQGDARLSYFAPSQILVVNNTPAVHVQVDEFLQSLRKSLPKQKAAAKLDAQVMPAQFALQESSRPASVVQTGPASYPVPTPPVGPKHLFHFIIRYEGEGIIDANVAKFTKEMMQGNSASSSASYAFPPPPVPPPGEPARAQTMLPPAAPPMPPAEAPATDRAPSKAAPPAAPPPPPPPPPVAS